MTAALKRLQRDVHDQREQQEDEPEREREPEVALARVQGDRGREGAGLGPDVAPHGHGGSDLRYHVAEGGGNHRGEREPRLTRHGPRGAPAAGAEGLGGAAEPRIEDLDGGGGQPARGWEGRTNSLPHRTLPGESHSKYGRQA